MVQIFKQAAVDFLVKYACFVNSETVISTFVCFVLAGERMNVCVCVESIQWLSLRRYQHCVTAVDQATVVDLQLAVDSSNVYLCSLVSSHASLCSLYLNEYKHFSAVIYLPFCIVFALF